MHKVVKILARLVSMWGLRCKGITPTRDNIEEPSASNLETAEMLVLLSAMPDTFTAVKNLKLLSLCPKRSGCLIVTSGRVGESSLSRLLGIAALPILMPSKVKPNSKSLSTLRNPLSKFRLKVKREF